jgi:hypothetical protein
MAVANRLNRVVALIYRLPAKWRPRATLSIANRRQVQNHLNGVHALAMALLAESATGFLVAMNLPEHKLLLLKTLKVDYRQRVVGGLTAEQIAGMAQHDKGEVWVTVTVTEQTGSAPIECAMRWAWLSKKGYVLVMCCRPCFVGWALAHRRGVRALVG